MDTVNYTVAAEDALPCKEQIMLSKTSADNYTDEQPPVIATYRSKLLCMTAKQPNTLRVLNRQGKFTDTRTPIERITHLCSTEAHPDHTAMFYAVGGKELAVLTPSTLASGDVHVEMKTMVMPDDAVAATAGAPGRAFVLSRRCVYDVDISTGGMRECVELAPRTVTRSASFDYNHGEHLLLVPSKEAYLDIVSTLTQGSVLGKIWEPHGDSMPTFARFFQSRGERLASTAGEAEGHEVCIITAARGNAELRYWTFNLASKKFTLRQEVVIGSRDVTAEYALGVTLDEAYITLASRRSGHAVVIKNSMTEFKAERLTTWRTGAASLACASYVGKFAKSAQSQSATYELCLITRTRDGFYKYVLDADKLVGGGGRATEEHSSVASWFDGATTHVAVPPVAAITQLTAVSSSLRGESKATNAISEASAAGIVRQQTQKFCEQIRLLDADFVRVQKTASSTMCLLQGSTYREQATAAGRDFAARNKGRLQILADAAAAKSEQQAEPGTMSEGQRKLILAITNVVKEVEGSTANTTSAALKLLLQRQLKQSVEKVSKEMEGLAVGGTATVNISGTEAAMQYRAAIDSVISRILAAVRERQNGIRRTLDYASKETSAVVQRAHEFAGRLHGAVQEAQKETEAIRDAVVQLQLNQAPQPVDPDTLTARAVALAERDDWAGAFTVALESSDITVLLGFLESKVCEEKRAIANSPNTLTLPLFLSLCLQLVFMMDSQPASIPLRVQLLHDFYLEWDDVLKNIKAQATRSAAHVTSFETVKRELTTVMDALNAVDPQLLDRRNRSKCRLVVKLIDALVSGA